MSNLDESMSKAQRLPNPTMSLLKKPTGAPIKSTKSQAEKTVKGSKQAGRGQSSGLDSDKSTSGYDAITDKYSAARLTSIEPNRVMESRTLSQRLRAARQQVSYPVGNLRWQQHCRAARLDPYLRALVLTARRLRTPLYPRPNNCSRRTRVNGPSLSTNWRLEIRHSSISKKAGGVPIPN